MTRSARDSFDGDRITHPDPPLIPISEPLCHILEALAREGYRAFVAGGAVRDALLGLIPKDLDIEVYGCTYEQLGQVLRRVGRVSTVGRQFGILKLARVAGYLREAEVPRGQEFDFAVPRRENRVGIAHTDFATTFDPAMTPREAASRRDFTCNALIYDPLANELHDYFGGERDLKAQILRHTSEKFREDPLRVLRGMQFAARFELSLAPETAALAREMAEEIAALVRAAGGPPDRIPKELLSTERIAEEWMKLALQGHSPGRAIDYLIETGWIRFFPEIRDVVYWPTVTCEAGARDLGVPQEPEWHPEGPVHVHTALVMDAAARIADEEGLSGDDRSVLVFAALAHDFAKAWTTHQAERIERRTRQARLRWVSPGHEEAGGYLAARFLLSIGIKQDLIRGIVPLVRNHLQHLQFHGDRSEWSLAVGLADRLRGPVFPLKLNRRGGDAASPFGNEAGRGAAAAGSPLGVAVSGPAQSECGPAITGGSSLKPRGGDRNPDDRRAAAERQIHHLNTLGLNITRDEFERWFSLGHGKATIRELALLIRADHAGRPPLPADVPPGARWMLHWAGEAGVLDGPMRSILRGRDLIDRGLLPGEEFSVILDTARRAQGDRVFGTRDEAERWLDHYLARTKPLLHGQDLIERGLIPGPVFGAILREVRDLQARRALLTRVEALAWLDERLTGEAAQAMRSAPQPPAPSPAEPPGTGSAAGCPAGEGASEAGG